MVKHPERDESRTAFRRLIEALAQATPITAALAHLYGYTHPSQFERDLEKFRRDIATSVNSQEERLDRLEAVLAPRAAVGTLALEVAFHVLRTNDTGRRLSVGFDVLRDAFPKVEKGLLEEAAAELDHSGYATTTTTFGHPIFRVSPTTSMFLAFDLVATGRDTRADALEIARIWLNDEATHNTFLLLERLKWEPRRLNPPLSTLCRLFQKGRYSNEIHPILEATFVLITPNERFKLRRMLDEGRVD